MENEEAKALQEVAKFGTRALESSDKLAAFLSKIFGTVPSDVVGVVGGDWLHHIRIRNAAKLAQRTEEILRDRGILEQTEPMSPSLALPLLHAAQDETREELSEMWARMLSNGMDPSRSASIRQSIILTVKSFDPLDAVILQMVFDRCHGEKTSVEFNLTDLLKELGVSSDELELSLSNLLKLGCGSSGRGIKQYKTVILNFQISPLGREVIRACSL
jgi:hypothetical protein